jgi:hypothetical protein
VVHGGGPAQQIGSFAQQDDDGKTRRTMMNVDDGEVVEEGVPG